VIILDTHAWIWWATDSSNLSLKAAKAIEKASQIGIPAICCWEIAMLEAKKRLSLSIDVGLWINLALQKNKVQIIPLTPEIAVLSSRLPEGFHGDPADRLIAATSLAFKAPLVTKDSKMLTYSFLKTIWD
jgi:PIN domain nuclease of toxin-antitoxin system